jgi:putative peptidoglycan lipid II flippase
MGLAAGVFGGALLGLRQLSAPWLGSLRPGDTYRWPFDFLPLALWVGLALSLAGALYLGTALLLRLPEAGALLDRARRVIKR